MKNILLLISLVVVAVGCSPQAPTMKRVVSYDLIDEHYLKEVFVPSFADQTSKSALSNSVIQLDAHLAEFRDFMHQVEAGKIAVTENIKGGWQSSVVTDEVSMLAGYSSRLGLVSQFDKRKNQDPYPLIYGFQISTNGYISWATTVEDGFQFDEHGKVQRYWRK